MVKNVLFVAHDFSPVNSPGTSRAKRIVSNLPDENLHFSVLTVSSSTKANKGKSSDDRKYSFVKIIRVIDFFERPGGWAVRSNEKPGKVQRMKAGVIAIAKEILVPDRSILWGLAAGISILIKGRKKVPLDIVYSTSAPATNHLVAWIISKFRGIPWVAEFRDPLYGFHEIGKSSKFHRKILTMTEALVVRRAARVIVVTPGMKKLFEDRYSGLDVEVIPNAASFTKIEVSKQMKRRAARNEKGTLKLIYTGLLYGNLRPVEPLLQAISIAKPEIAALGRSIEVHFIGKDSETVLPVARSLNLGDAVKTSPFMSSKECLEAAKNADCCVILLQDSPKPGLELPSKYFDYITTGNPILVMGNCQSDLAQLVVSEDHSGVCYEYHDIQGLSNWLLFLATNDQAMLPNALAICEAHSDKKLANKIREVLDSVSTS